MQRQICSRVPAAFFMKSIINENLDYSKMKMAALDCCASAARQCYNDSKTEKSSVVVKIQQEAREDLKMGHCPITDDFLMLL